MIDVIKVAKAVKNLMELSDSDIDGILPSAKSACIELSNRLKDEKFAKDERAINAAVYLCYYRYILKLNVTGEFPNYFKAGDLQVTQSPALMLERAAMLRDDAICQASPLLEDLDFVFRQV